MAKAPPDLELPPAQNPRIQLVRIATGDRSHSPAHPFSGEVNGIDSEVEAMLEAEHALLLPEASPLARA